MKKKFTFIFLIIINLTALPVLPQSLDSRTMNDSVKTFSAMPKFIPEENIDYKILESVADSTVDYKILESTPDQYIISPKPGIIPDSLLKKYNFRKKFKK